MKILITGFDAFGGEKINPAQKALELLPEKIDDLEITKLILPTVFYDSAEILKNKIAEIQPNIVISVGQAGGIDHIRIERVAINIDDARIADNKGQQPIDEIIQETGENAYFATLPIKAINNELKNNNIPSEISNSAGTFVCNHIMYQGLHLAKDYNLKAGFIHIPFLPEQVVAKPNIASMPLEEIVSALTIIIKTAAKFYKKEDLKQQAGKIF